MLPNAATNCGLVAFSNTLERLDNIADNSYGPCDQGTEANDAHCIESGQGNESGYFSKTDVCVASYHHCLIYVTMLTDCDCALIGYRVMQFGMQILHQILDASMQLLRQLPFYLD